MGRFLALALLTVFAATACAPLGPAAPVAPARPDASASRYRCDDASELTVRFGDDTATVVGAGLDEQLLRDAGGLTPQQSVYSNSRLRVEFGLGTGGGEALLHYLSPPRQIHCMRAAAS